jgi:hypothetical protein
MSNHLFSRRFRVAAVVLALGAASFGVSARTHAAKSSVKKGHAKAPAQSEDCKADKDCVLVADDCCSCAEGGKQRAIPKKQKDAYEKERKKRCGDTACTEMVSTDPSCAQRPFCGAGICELGDAPADAAP